MLVVERKLGESVIIGNDIKITICKINTHKVKVGIEAPSDIIIDREEVRNKPDYGKDYIKGRHKHG